MTWDIGIDVRMIQHTGIGTYLREILPGLVSEITDRGFSAALFESPSSPSTQHAHAHRPFRPQIYSLQEQFEYPLLLKQCRLWHSPHYNIPLIKGKTKLVVTIHDIIHWIFRKQFMTPLQTGYAGFMLQKAVQASDHILTVSEHTKSDLVNHFQANPKKITVALEAFDPVFLNPVREQAKNHVRAKYALPESFFLYVGSLKPHKNLHWLLSVFAGLKQRHKVRATLVLAGRPDLKNPVLMDSIREHARQGTVLHLTEVPGEDLPALYQMAVSLIHPSLYEGFGLTLLEAMASGTPVIACHNSSIPEVAGDSAYLIGTSHSQELEDAIIALETNLSLRQSLSEKGRNRAARFSWNTTSQQTMAVYEKVLNSL